ncbi:MAG: mechanosensitive ion channel [Deltaproteobacteria bacterium]|nr:mechanosensitive ion channel [Deltaproteobacteria bacterium]
MGFMWGNSDVRTSHRSGWPFLFALCLAVALVSQPTRAQQAPLPGVREKPAAEGSLELGEIEGRITTFRRRLGEWKRKSLEYQRVWEQVATRVQVIDREIDQLKAREGIVVPEEASSSELDARLLEAEQDLSSARRKAMALDAEEALRSERRKKIPKLLASAKQKRSALGIVAPTVSADPAVSKALAVLEGLKHQVLDSEIEAYQNELASYEARGRLLSKQRDRATLRIAYYEALSSELREAAKQRGRMEVERESEATQRLLEGLKAAPKSFEKMFREMAAQNAELADFWTGDDGVVDQIDDVSEKLSRAEEKVASLEGELAGLAVRVEAVGLADSVGVLLRRQRADAPDIGMYRRFVRMRQERIGYVQLQQIRLREQRQALGDIDALVDQAMASVEEPMTPEERAKLEGLLRQLFETQRRYMDALMADYETYFQKLVDFDARQREMIDRTQDLLDFIDERILWIPSGRAIETETLSDGRDATRWLFGPRYLKQLGRGASEAATRLWSLNLLALLLAILFFPARRRLRDRIRQSGQEAASPDCVRYGPTAKALGLTIVLAAWLPALLAYVGWRLGASPAATQYTRSVAYGLLGTSGLWFTLALTRQLARSGGVAEAHCGWPAKPAHALWRDVAWLAVVMVPATFVILVFEMRGEDLWRESIGRMAFLVTMLAVALFNYLALRRDGAASGLLLNGVRRRSVAFRIVQLASIAVPVGLGVAAIRGFYWTALQLAMRTHLTLVFLFLLVIVVQLFARWAMIAERRAALEADAPEEKAAPATSGIQVSRLMIGTAMLIALFGSLAIWADLLPAARILRQVELWSVTKTITVAELDPSGVERLYTEARSVPITLADLFRSFLIALLSLALIRNLPGLLEATVFRRLGRGERYAYATIVKYAVALAGLALAFDAIGVGWSSIQWLVAAVGLGLGFGLQEIFANFISGLIILFERPIRVGDTVTVGDISGTVTKIQIRATWITGFDRKELVVPNKTFVTGQLINWTLSDAVLRVEILVGIAYGSDTERAIEVLQRVAGDNRRVLRDPAPQVLFLAFADSSLSFELRLFVPHVSEVLPVRHELHMAIDKAFKDAGIEIAFPQQDLHLRSLPDNWRTLASG